MSQMFQDSGQAYRIFKMKIYVVYNHNEISYLQAYKTCCKAN